MKKKKYTVVEGYLENPHDVDFDLIDPCDEPAKVRQREAEDAGYREEEHHR